MQDEKRPGLDFSLFKRMKFANPIDAVKSVAAPKSTNGEAPAVPLENYLLPVAATKAATRVVAPGLADAQDDAFASLMLKLKGRKEEEIEL